MTADEAHEDVGPGDHGDHGEQEEATASPGLIDRIADHLDAFQRRHRPIAFPVAVLKRFGEDRGSEYTAIIAYYGFLSLLPLLLVVVTILGRLLQGDPELQERILDTVLGGFPVVGEELRTNVKGLQGSGFVLVIGLAFSLWGALGVVQAFQEACNTMWGVPRHRRPDIFRRVGRGLGLLAVLGTAVLVVTIGTPLLLALPLPRVATVLTVLGGGVLAGGVLVLAFQLLTAERIPWRSLVPGAVVGGVLLTLLNALGGLYLSRVVARAGNLYGTFAVVIGLFVWIALFARLVLLSYEVNVVLIGRLWPRSTSGRDLGPADRRALDELVQREALVAEQQVTTVVDGIEVTATDRDADPSAPR
ncbi:MAG: YihY/virulence factor BrkB family protein [Acidimicrobiales bacterium]